MKTFIARICIFCLLFLSLYMMLPMQSKAADKIDLEENVSVTIFHEIDGKGIADVEFSIYRVGNISKNGKSGFSANIKKYGLELDMGSSSAIKSTADALQGYLLRDKVSPLYTAKTDANGVVVFQAEGTMKPGLYLICGKSYTLDDGRICNIQPNLRVLPEIDENGTPMYEIKVESKHEVVEDSAKIKVVKVWKDKTTEYRPREIKVQLINTVTKEVYSTAALKDANKWSYTWNDLPSGYTWTVVEKTVPEHYTLSSDRNGYTIRLTNTSDKSAPEDPVQEPEKPEKPNTPDTLEPGTPESPKTGKLPQTGTLWWPVPLMAIVGIGFIIIGVSRKAEDEM